MTNTSEKIKNIIYIDMPELDAAQLEHLVVTGLRSVVGSVCEFVVVGSEGEFGKKADNSNKTVLI